MDTKRREKRKYIDREREKGWYKWRERVTKEISYIRKKGGKGLKTERDIYRAITQPDSISE